MHKPQYATAQQLADYFTWMVETGKGHHLPQEYKQ